MRRPRVGAGGPSLLFLPAMHGHKTSGLRGKGLPPEAFGRRLVKPRRPRGTEGCISYSVSWHGVQDWPQSTTNRGRPARGNWWAGSDPP